MKVTDHLQRGFTLLEGIVALTVLLGLLILGNGYVQRRLEDDINQCTAEQLQTVTMAANCYLQRNDTAPQKERVIPLTVEQLKKVNCLPQSFTGKNCYQQTYTVVVIPSPKGTQRRQVLTLTQGGNPISEQSMRQIARRLGGSGGYISKRHSNKIVGTQQGWKIALEPPDPASDAIPDLDYDPDLLEHLENAKVGQVASLQTLDGDDLMDVRNFLHRRQMQRYNEELNKMENDEALNQMETDLVMHDNKIIFEKSQPSEGQQHATLSATGLRFSHNKEDKGNLQDNDSIIIQSSNDQQYPDKASIQVDHNNNRLSLTASRVGFNKNDDHFNLPYQKLWIYSPAELHTYWNKIPYYELRRTSTKDSTQDDYQAAAESVCHLSAVEEEKKEKSVLPLGRLFMLGREGIPTTHLYICSHGVKQGLATAYLIKSLAPMLPPASSAANCHHPTTSHQ